MIQTETIQVKEISSCKTYDYFYLIKLCCTFSGKAAEKPLQCKLLLKAPHAHSLTYVISASSRRRQSNKK